MNEIFIIGKKFFFDVCLEDWVEGMDYCVLCVLFEIMEVFGMKGLVFVMVCVNEFEFFQVSFFLVGGGQYYICIKVKVWWEIYIKMGDCVWICIIVFDCFDVVVFEDLLSVFCVEGVEVVFKLLLLG